MKSSEDLFHELSGTSYTTTLREFFVLDVMGTLHEIGTFEDEAHAGEACHEEGIQIAFIFDLATANSLFEDLENILVRY